MYVVILALHREDDLNRDKAHRVLAPLLRTQRPTVFLRALPEGPVLRCALQLAADHQLIENAFGDADRYGFALSDLAGQVGNAQPLDRHRNHDGHEGERRQNFGQGEASTPEVNAGRFAVRCSGSEFHSSNRSGIFRSRPSRPHFVEFGR